MKINKDVIYRNIAGEHVLIPIGSAAMENNGMFILTELGAEIWQMLEKGREKEEMVSILLEKYDVEEEILRKDVNEYLEKLKDGGLVSE